MAKKKRQSCFVIMPFSATSDEHTEEYWTQHFRQFLKPLIEGCSTCEAKRSEPLRGDLLRRIITELVTCPIVVADLTDSNPNVYWELGLRQSFKHGTVTIAEEGTALPFDVSTKGTLVYYPKDHVKNAEFCKRFGDAVNDCISKPDETDSHVLETVSGRGTLFEIFRRDEAIRRLEAVLSECRSNLSLVKQVMEQARENQEKPEGAVYVTYTLRTSAAELLVTNRYLDEESSFYDVAEEYVGYLEALHGRMLDWPFPDRTDSIEKWFLKQEDSVKSICEVFKNQVLTARRELIKNM